MVELIHQWINKNEFEKIIISLKQNVFCQQRTRRLGFAYIVLLAAKSCILHFSAAVSIQ